jgi:hypothetical protein
MARNREEHVWNVVDLSHRADRKVAVDLAHRHWHGFCEYATYFLIWMPENVFVVFWMASPS